MDADQTAAAGDRYGEFRFQRKFATCDPRDYRIEVIKWGICFDYSDNGEGWTMVRITPEREKPIFNRLRD
jgi:hypothetical protein